MSFINLEFMGIQSPDIMADSVDTKQMLLTLNTKLDWLNGSIFASISLNALEYPISQKLHERQ
jgi:hypothetical protein